MARTRVFVSSTYYDLKHVRASLEAFIDSLGYEAVLSEKGDIAFAPDMPLDESCYREVANADMFVLIIGGRYGSERSGLEKVPKDFFTRYDSITKEEYKSAVQLNIPTYILIERGVHAEYQTFLKNADSTSIKYAHVDSVNVFHLIREIFAQPRNNPVHEFDRYSDIVEWLREQWSGLFKDLLKRVSGQQQIASLSAQVLELSEINKTLKRYLEEVVTRVAPDESKDLISTEDRRLKERAKHAVLESNPLLMYLVKDIGLPGSHVLHSLQKAVTAGGFVQLLLGKADAVQKPRLEGLLTEPVRTRFIRDTNRAREDIELPPILDTDPTESAAVETPRPRRRKGASKQPSVVPAA